MAEVWLVIFLFFVCVGAQTGEPVVPYEQAFQLVQEYTLPEMPYNYSALEPYIDEETMKVHHLGHHKAYTDKLNRILKEWRDSGEEKELASKSLVQILKQIDKVPEKFRFDLNNNAGGYFSHALLWATMSPNPTDETRELGDVMYYLVMTTFLSVERFEKWVKHEAINMFGSGNLWLCAHPKHPHHVKLVTLHNQDTPFRHGMYPILLVDVWEHAYYVKYQNKKEEYLDNWWKVIDWDAVENLIRRWGVSHMHDEL